MMPTILRIGSFSLSSYYVMAMVGLVVGLFLLMREAKRLNLNRKTALDTFIIVSAAGFIGARIQHIIFDGFFEIYLQRPLAMFAIWKGGLAYYGGVIFGIPAVVLFLHIKKAPIIRYFDAMSYGAAFGVAMGRAGCYLNGCCFGDISSSSFAAKLGIFKNYGDSARHQFTNNIADRLGITPLPVIPAQLISFAANIGIFLILYFVVRKFYKKDGVPFGAWLVMYAIFRFIIEYFRSDDRGLFFNNLLSTSQIIAIFGLVLGLALIFLPAKSAKKSNLTA